MKRHGFSILVTILALVAAIAISMTAPAGAAAATQDVSCVRIEVTGLKENDLRAQFKMNRAFAAGDEAVIYIKPQDASARLRIRGDDSSTTFLQAYFGGDTNLVNIGDGWYAARFTVEKYDDQGEPDDSYTTSKLYVTIDKYTTAVGDVFYLRDMSVNDTAVSNSTLLSYYSKSSDYPSVAGSETVAVDTGSLTYEWPVMSADDFYTKEYFGDNTLPTYDTSMYTWQINSGLNGAVNLPEVQLAATGRYQDVTNVNDDLIAALTTTTFADANNMIFFISDGFGQNFIKLTEFFAGDVIMNDLPNRGLSYTSSYAKPGNTGFGLITTDSAAGGTALSCGYRTRYSYEAVDYNGNPISQITELLRPSKVIGVATTGWAYDATPAVYGGAHETRGSQEAIAAQMTAFGPDLWIGEGMKDYANKSFFTGAVADQDVAYLSQWPDNSGAYSGRSKVWINLIEDVRYSDSFTSGHPTISQMMAFSLAWLQAKSFEDNDKGFFLMFENGMTDDAGHKNDCYKVIGETRASSEAMAVALKFACENPDTIVIHTADHETGGLKLRSGWKEDVTKIKFTTSGHSNQEVEVFAIGKGTEMFNGQYIFNAQVGKLTGALMGLTMGSAEAEFDISAILNGEVIAVEVVETDPVDPIEGKRLQAYADKDGVTGITWTFNDISMKAHDNCSVDIRVPDGATYLEIIGVTSNGAEESIKAFPTDRTVNYMPLFSYYSIGFKPESDYAKLRFRVTGTFADKSCVFMDNLSINSDLIDFTVFDISGISPEDNVTVWVSDEEIEPPLPEGLPVVRLTADDAGSDRFQIQTNIGIAPGDEIELWINTNGLEYAMKESNDSTYFRSYNAKFKDQTTITDIGNGWYKLTCTVPSTYVQETESGKATLRLKIETRRQGYGVVAGEYIDIYKLRVNDTVYLFNDDGDPGAIKLRAWDNPSSVTASIEYIPEDTLPAQIVANLESCAIFKGFNHSVKGDYTYIQFKINTPVAANSTVSYDFMPYGIYAANFKYAGIRLASNQDTKLLRTSGTSSIATEGNGSDYIAADPAPTIVALGNGFYRVTFTTKTDIQGGLCLRFVVNKEDKNYDSMCDIAFDNLTITSGSNVLKCSFNAGNIVSNERNDIRAKYDNGTAFTIKRGEQLYWDMTVVCPEIAVADHEVRTEIFSDFYISQNLSLGSDITYVIRTVTGSYDMDGVRVRFSADDKISGLTAGTPGENGRYEFRFTGITPQMLDVPIRVEIITEDAVKCKVLSLLDYLDYVYGNFPEYRDLIDGLKLYCGASQTYRSYLYSGENVAAGMTVPVTEAPASVKGAGCEDGSPAKFLSATVVIDYINRIKFYFGTNDVQNTVVKVFNSSNVVVQELSADDFIYDAAKDRYSFRTDGIFASKFGETYTARLYVNGTETAWATYSINSYINSKWNDSSDKLRNLVRSLYAYGAAAEDFVNNN